MGEPEPAPLELAVWGDSHALAIMPGIDAIAREHEVGILSLWNVSTAPILDYVPAYKFSLGSETPHVNQAILDAIEHLEVPKVLLVARWPNVLRQGGAIARDQLIETVRQLSAASIKVYILMEVPTHRASVPKLLARRWLFGGDGSEFICGADRHARQNAEFIELLPDLRAAGAYILDPRAVLTTPDGASFLVESGGEALYCDSHHLSRAGAKFLSPVFEPIFSEDGH